MRAQPPAVDPRLLKKRGPAPLFGDKTVDVDAAACDREAKRPLLSIVKAAPKRTLASPRSPRKDVPRRSPAIPIQHRLCLALIARRSSLSLWPRGKLSPIGSYPIEKLRLRVNLIIVLAIRKRFVLGHKFLQKKVHRQARRSYDCERDRGSGEVAQVCHPSLSGDAPDSTTLRIAHTIPGGPLSSIKIALGRCFFSCCEFERQGSPCWPVLATDRRGGTGHHPALPSIG